MMPSLHDIDISSVTSKSYPILAQLRTALWPQDSYEEHLADLADLCDNHGMKAWLAFDSTATAIGFLELSTRPYVNGCLYRPVAFIEGIYCAPAWQQSGLGAALVKVAEDWAKAEGIREIASDTYAENWAARHAHQKWGFQETETVTYFRKHLSS